jgi:hypothetical protein
MVNLAAVLVTQNLGFNLGQKPVAKKPVTPVVRA